MLPQALVCYLENYGKFLRVICCMNSDGAAAVVAVAVVAVAVVAAVVVNDDFPFSNRPRQVCIALFGRI